MYYSEEAVRRLGGDRMVKRWKRKPVGAESGKRGYDFEDLWAIFQLAASSAEVIRQLETGTVPALGDNRIAAKRLECFVDDFDLIKNGYRTFYQLKTGAGFSWVGVDYDFWAQRVLDVQHRITAEYCLVVDSWDGYDHAMDHLEEASWLGHRDFDVIVFEATMDFGPFIKQQPRLDEYLTLLCRSAEKDQKRTLFARMMLTCKEPHTVYALKHVVDEFKHIHISQPELISVAAGLIPRGIEHCVKGSQLRMRFNGFTGTFIVPCDPLTLNQLQQQIEDESVPNIDIIDWMISKGW